MDKMKQFGYKFASKMAHFMYGRNGFDAMARVSYIAALVLMIINVFVQNNVIHFLWIVFFVYSMFRVYSKNIPKRYAENQKFLSKTEVPRKYVKLAKLQWRDRATSRYYICSGCHQQIRVPKGKGKIEIRCPKCGNRFVRKT